MNVNKKYYPYPVLTPYTDDIKNSVYETSVSCSRRGEFYIFKLRCITSNDYLFSLIEKSEAIYLFHFECAITGFRKTYTTQKNELEISIPVANLKDTVEICSFITANKDIATYCNPDAAEDYGGSSFYIEKGCVLAVGNPCDIKIPKITDELASKDSIFLIIKSDNSKDHSMKIDTSGDRLKVILPSDDFNNYRILKSNGFMQPVLTSMIIVPALIFSLQELKYAVENQTDWADKKDLKWVQTIQQKVKKECKLELEEFIKDCDPVEYAQELIGSPITLGLNNLAEKNNEDDIYED